MRKRTLPEPMNVLITLGKFEIINMPKSLWIFLLLSLYALLVQGQKDSLAVRYDASNVEKLTITEEDLTTFKENPKFDYEEVKSEAPEWWLAFKNWLGNLLLKFFEWLFGVEKAAGAFNTFLQFLPYLLILVLLFILIKFFLNVNARSMSYAKKNQALVTLSEEEHIIKNEDIQELIKNALAEKNYRLAIRYYYLLTLQTMSNKELIDWEQQKTNTDYITELKKENLKYPFTRITRLYDYIWYGDFPIDENKYKKAASSFESLQNLLNNA
ncbi:DUF4129 domain-containing protein [Maribacter sp. 2210JD10-5]|uniref:DUF4129 domain-containing protein n=1 Tax=Maribacter sp. 2210JD10-5 TaxID=3386272 RepID=UPI0039BCEEE3